MGEMKAIRNIDEETYRRFKAQAAAEGRNIGAVLSDAMRAYLRRRVPRKVLRMRAEEDVAGVAQTPPATSGGTILHPDKN